MYSLSDNELAYIAGLFDGEGCIRLHVYKNGKASINFKICMTACDLLEGLCESTGLGTTHIYQPKYNRRRAVCYWNIAANQAVELCKAILPWTRLKRGQIEVILDYANVEPSMRRAKRLGISDELKIYRQETAMKLSALKAA